MTCLARRSLCLIAFYAIAAVAPVVVSLLTTFNGVSTLPLLWLSTVPVISGVMLLTLWAGLGNGRLSLRLIGLLAGLAYLALWPTLQMWLRFQGQPPSQGQFRFTNAYIETLYPYVLLGVILAGMFVITRSWVQLRSNVPGEVSPTPSRMQFSVFHLLVLMSTLALVLTLVRRARGTGNAESGFSPGLVAAYVLIGFTIFANTASAIYAALSAKSVMRNCLLVSFASILLGVAFAVASRHEILGPLMFASGVMALAFPTFLVLASLLWLRPCGLRLVRRQNSGKDPSAVAPAASIENTVNPGE